MRILTASFFLFITLNTGLAQTGNFSFTVYNTANGLPDNNVQSIMQDSRGFLWIGTMEGLSRFDGKTFRNFFASRNDTVVKANAFSNIYEYKPGHLVMNNYNRVICFNSITEKFYLPPSPLQSGHTIAQWPEQNGYCITATDKTYILNSRLEVTDSITVLPQKPVNEYLASIYIGKKDTLLVQYNKQFYLFNIKKRQFEKLAFDMGPVNPVSHVAYFRYFDPLKQEIYLSDYLLGLFRYSLLTRKTERLVKAANGVSYNNGFLYAVIPRQNNELWFLTEGGINILDTAHNTVSVITSTKGKTNSLSSNSCYTGYTDKQNNVWIGTSDGISKLNAGSLVLQTWTEEFFTSKSNGLMSAVKGADGMMYVSVYNNKAYKVNPATGSVSALNHPLNQLNWNLFIKGDEVIRTGGTNSMLSYNTSTGKLTQLDFLKPFYPDVELIVLGFIHSNGDEWYCANRGGGFVRKLAGTNTFKTYRKGDGVNNFTSSYYTSYTEDDKGDLWFGVNKSSYLVHWNAKTDRFEEIMLNDRKGLEHVELSGVNAVTHDHENNIWVAYNGSGVVKYNTQTKLATQYGINDGLPTNYISGLAFDNKGRLWLTTYKGLSCFIVDENKFINFKKDDGLADDYFSDYCIYYDSAANRLWAGANSTLMAFTPEELLKLTREKFPVYLNDIYINSKRYDEPSEEILSLRSSENSLQFHFTGVDLGNAADIEYSFRLDGADKDWIYTGTNQSASYSRLKPGNYVFYVRARHRGDNKWNEMSSPLYFTIATPWYKTWWFSILAVLLMASLIWFIIRAWYLRKIEKQKALLEKKQAIEMERTRIATDMHDDFGASLSRIKFLSEKLQLHKIQHQGEKTDLEKISLYSDEMAEKMNEIVWALNQRYDSLGDLISFCRSYASEYLQDKDIRLIFNADETGEQNIQGEVRRNIFLVIKESLRNIVKHAAATEVSIRFQLNMQEKQIMVIIHDNGKGINMENIRPFANGLENMKKRIADINGRLTIRNVNGTEISLSAPI